MMMGLAMVTEAGGGVVEGGTVDEEEGSEEVAAFVEGAGEADGDWIESFWSSHSVALGDGDGCLTKTKQQCSAVLMRGWRGDHVCFAASLDSTWSAQVSFPSVGDRTSDAVLA